MTRLALAGSMVAMLVACGPTDRGTPTDAAVDEPDADPALNATLTGVVWAPGNGPGMVPASHEFPVSGAIVYATTDKPTAIPQGVYCDRCQMRVGRNTVSDAKGLFRLSLPAGHYWLSVEKGQFRLEQEIDVASLETVQLTATQTTLPSKYDPANGMWTPRIALATGNYDHLEDILAKLGLGQVDDDGVLASLDASDNVDLFFNGGLLPESIQLSGNFDALLTDLPAMKQYHVIIVPCTGNEATSPIFNDPTVRQNLRDYVAAGGKLYVTDWSAEWEDVPFPAFIAFDAEHDTTDPDCVGTACANGDGSPQYASFHAHAADAALHDWLDAQHGPIYQGGAVVNGIIDADDFEVQGNWDRIVELPTVDLGVDAEGNPVTQIAKAWVQGDEAGMGDHPLTVTFEPGGCGRVLYSTYHTADTTHAGLVPQERVLVYLLMEIGVCNDNPVIQ